VAESGKSELPRDGGGAAESILGERRLTEMREGNGGGEPVRLLVIMDQ
jgi:hypothetical protein